MDNKKKLLRLLRSFFIIAGVITISCFRITTYAATGGVVDNITGSDSDKNESESSEDVEKKPVYDEVGHVSLGYATFVGQNDGYVYDLYFNNPSGVYIVKTNDNYTVYSIDGSKISVEGTFKIGTVAEVTYQQRYEYSGWSLIPSENGVRSNIPIFDSTDENFDENLDKYVKDGDMSGASNKDDLFEPSENDDSVPAPSGLKVGGSFKSYAYNPVFDLANDGLIYPNNLDLGSIQMSVFWNYPESASEYKYDVQVSLKKREKDGTSSWSSWCDYITGFTYSTQYDLTTGEPVSMEGLTETLIFSRDTFASLSKKIFPGQSTTAGYFFYVEGIQLRVRNKKGNKVSNWVEIHSTSDASYAYETDSDGNRVDSDEYDGSNVNSDTGIAGSGGNISVDGFTGYVKSGFGLLGNGGLIALMSAIFLYIPNSIWTLVKAGISAAIIIMLFTLVKRAIFG